MASREPHWSFFRPLEVSWTETECSCYCSCLGKNKKTVSWNCSFFPWFSSLFFYPFFLVEIAHDHFVQLFLFAGIFFIVLISCFISFMCVCYWIIFLHHSFLLLHVQHFSFTLNFRCKFFFAVLTFIAILLADDMVPFRHFTEMIPPSCLTCIGEVVAECKNRGTVLQRYLFSLWGRFRLKVFCVEHKSECSTWLSLLFVREV